MGVSQGALATAPLPSGPGRWAQCPPHLSIFPMAFWELESESPLQPFSRSYLCTPTRPLFLAAPSPMRMCLPHLFARPTQLRGDKLPSDVSCTQVMYTQLHRVVHSLHAPLHMASQFLPVTVTGLPVLSHWRTHWLSQTHTAVPTAGCTCKHPCPVSHAWARPGSPAGPPPAELHTGGTHAHTHTHACVPIL